jgi:hypothetical protein
MDKKKRTYILAGALVVVVSVVALLVSLYVVGWAGSGDDFIATPAIDVQFEEDEKAGAVVVRVDNVEESDKDYLVFLEEDLSERYDGDVILELPEKEDTWLSWLGDDKAPDAETTLNLSGKSGEIHVLGVIGEKPPTRTVTFGENELEIAKGDIPENATQILVYVHEYEFGRTDESRTEP